MTDETEQVALKALQDATRRMRGHLTALDVWIEQMLMAVHSLKHELTKLALALQLLEQERENNSDARLGDVES